MCASSKRRPASLNLRTASVSKGTAASGGASTASAAEAAAISLTVYHRAAALAAAGGIADWARHGLSVRSLQEFHEEGQQRLDL